MGVVIRNSDGEVLRVGCQQAKQALEPSIVEAKAIVFGLQMAVQMYAKLIVLEGDCLKVISKCKNKELDGTYLGVMIREILALANNFEAVSFEYVVREANGVAHAIAHITPLDYSTRVWVGGWVSSSDRRCCGV
ncbi:uncharacterized protein [Spinacia oleracea]|uniref:RNase H type-1 domain-containing protein n=1 Tax=Spinacia oleracea TaxID=3562 RepID=A0ABM3R7U1_SPIOL|nr:uncharacterized protein LOC130467247 [Spinacia oleracea]